MLSRLSAVRATPAQFRGGIPAFSAASSSASGASLPTSSPAVSDTASVGEKSTGDDTSPQLETKAGRPRKRKEVEKRASNSSGEFTSDWAGTVGGLVDSLGQRQVRSTQRAAEHGQTRRAVDLDNHKPWLTQRDRAAAH